MPTLGSRKAGVVSQIIEFKAYDSTTGVGATGKTSADFTASYSVENGARVGITLSAGSVGDSFSAGKVAEIDATNKKGSYYLHVSNAAFSAAGLTTITIQGTGMVIPEVKIPIVAYDPASGTNLGLSNLDAAVTTRSSHSAADVATAVWTAGARTITSFGSLASDTATAVWANGTRTLSSFGTLVADVTSGVWSAGARTLTAFGFSVAVSDKTEFSLTSGERTAIASSVRTELATELARMDVETSTRLAAAGYTVPDNATVGAINAKLGSPSVSIADDLASVKGDTVELLDRITAAVVQLFTDLAAMITGSGSDPQFTESALSNSPASADGGATLEKQEEILEAIAGIDTGNSSPDPTPMLVAENIGMLRKQPGESVVFPFDFSGKLAPGDSLSSISSVVVTPTGPTPSGEEINGTETGVYVRIAGGVNGAMYRVTVTATTANGDTLEVDRKLYVRNT